MSCYCEPITSCLIFFFSPEPYQLSRKASSLAERSLVPVYIQLRLSDLLTTPIELCMLNLASSCHLVCSLNITFSERPSISNPLYKSCCQIIFVELIIHIYFLFLSLSFYPTPPIESQFHGNKAPVLLGPKCQAYSGSLKHG